MRVAAGESAQYADGVVRCALPVDPEVLRRRVEESEPGMVGRLRPLPKQRVVQGATQGVGRQDVQPLVPDHPGRPGHRIEHDLHTGRHGVRLGTPATAGGAVRGSPGQVVQMRAFGLVQLKSAGQRFEHLFGHPGQVAPLQPHVVVDGDPGQHGDLFPAQTGHPAVRAAVYRQSGLLRGDLRAPGRQEVTDLVAGIHDPTVERHWNLWEALLMGVLPVPVSTGSPPPSRNAIAWESAPPGQRGPVIYRHFPKGHSVTAAPANTITSMVQHHRPVVHPTAVLVLVLATYLMIIVDTSVVITGLPDIQADLALTATGLSWVQNAYLLAFGGLLLLGARAGDLYGRRRVLIVGLVLFTVASMLVGAAPSGGVLIAARVVQGVGAAVLAPSTLALLTAAFAEGPERSRAVAAYGSVAGIGTAFGLVLGGLVADVWSWRVAFAINLPIGVLLIVLAVRYLPRDTGRTGRLDLPGAVTSTAR